MVIELSTALAMRCPICGRLDVHQLNVFQLLEDEPHNFYCRCGSNKASITRKGGRYIAVDYYCIICDEEHTIIIPRKLFWSRNRLNSLLCLETDLNLGYYGPYKLIKVELDRQQQELDLMANELGFDDFADPEVMLEMLDYLHDLAAAGGFYCQCGNHDINIELFSDRLELSCNNCGSFMQVPASCSGDYNSLKELGEIVIKLNPANSPGKQTQSRKPQT